MHLLKPEGNGDGYGYGDGNGYGKGQGYGNGYGNGYSSDHRPFTENHLLYLAVMQRR